MSNRNSGMLMSILLGGWVAGTVDIGAAVLIYRVSPIVILQAIASGVLGKAAFDGEIAVAMLGLTLQWGMSLLIAGIYVLASRWFGWLNRHWVGAGTAYGAVIYLVMHYVVRPLSAAWPPTDFHFHAAKFLENLIAMIVFGLIIAWVTLLLARESDRTEISESASRDNP